MTDTTAPNQPSNKQLLLATAIALVVAGLLLVTTILPAEYNVDPLGTGALMGLTGMSQEQTVDVVNYQPIPYSRDVYTIELAPYESIEYKYRLEEGATMLFDWQAEGTLLFDLHAEQDGRDPQEYSPSFDQRQSDAEKGSYTAPFSGIHGWYWENRSANTVTLRLQTTGFYTKATEFARGFEREKTFPEADSQKTDSQKTEAQ